MRLPRQIPYARAMELLLTGDPIDAETALFARGSGVVKRDVVEGEFAEVARECGRGGALETRERRGAGGWGGERGRAAEGGRLRFGGHFAGE